MSNKSDSNPSQIDALIYSGIKNNLNSENFPYMDILKANIQSAGQISMVSPSDYDTLLESTTIKKACCGAKLATNSDNTYATNVVIPDSTGKFPYIQKKIEITTEMCNELDLKPTNNKCIGFKPLYCENANFFYINDKKNESFTDYAPYCSDYTLIKKTQDDIKQKQKEQASKEKSQKQIQSAIDKQIESMGSPPSPQPILKSDPNTKTLTQSGTQSQQSKGISTNTLIIIIIVILILFSLSAAAGMFLLRNKSG
jgi:hypothetical protein